MAGAAAEESIDLGRVIGFGGRVLARNLVPFLGLALLLGTLPSLLMFLFYPETVDPVGINLFNPVVLQGGLASTIFVAILQAALVRSVILDLNGRPPRVRASLTAAVRLILPTIAISILSLLLTVVGFLLLVVPGIIVYIMLMVAIPVLVEERAGVFASMRRSRELTKGSRWRIFLLLLVYFTLGFATDLLIRWIFSSTGVDEHSAAMLSQTIGGGLMSLLMAVLTASLYVELRSVREGVTGDGLARIFE